MADVTISYKNNEIATMNATGVKTLLTGDTFCEDDIVVAYTKPATPAPTLQAKTNISPTTSSQTVTADNGYDGLSSVQINAMPSGSAATPATTITANPSISVSSGGLITASNSKTQSVTPTVSAGYVSSGTAGTITVSGSNTSQLTTQAAQTIYPSTSDQTIASGKYLTGTQTFKGVLLTNLTADNIKKDVVVKVGDSADDDRITSVTGTYEGSGGGGVTLKKGAIRPDAELVQTWDVDYLAVTDKGATIPAYQTSAKNLVSRSTLSSCPVDYANYHYYFLCRNLVIPQYNTATIVGGRFEYWFSVWNMEYSSFYGNQIKALANASTVAAANSNFMVVINETQRLVYFSGSSSLSTYDTTNNKYACYLTRSAPSSSSSSITPYSPQLSMRGSATYFSQTYWNALTDIRVQVKMELYRVPLNTKSTYGINGWDTWSQIDSIMDNIKNNNGALS